MILPDPLIFARPFHVWLGLVLYILIVVQILIGTKFLKVPFWWHTRVNWVAIIAIATVHGIYGFQIYFLR